MQTAAHVAEAPAAGRSFFIIDCLAQVFRAYYAMGAGMTSPHTGEPTNALFGVAGMFLKLFRRYRPDYLVLATDSPGKTFRDEWDPEYKAHRDPPPTDLLLQVPRVFEMSGLFGVPVVACSGAEADDVIATLTRRVVTDPALGDVVVRLVSKDKDLEQLLSDRVALLDVHTEELIDPPALMQLKGYRPDQARDALALIGDKVDNVRGVDGIGPKTAAKLLQQYGSLEGVLGHVAELKGKLKENIERAMAHLPLTRRLVTLRDDLEIELDLATARAGRFQPEALRELFQRLGFNRHLRELDALLDAAGHPAPASADAPMMKQAPSATASQAGTVKKKSKPRPAPGQGSLFGEADLGSDAAEPAAAGVDPVVVGAGVVGAGLTTAEDFDYRAVTTRAELGALIERLAQAGVFALDTETIGLGSQAELAGLSVATEPGRAWYVPVRSPDPAAHLGPGEVLGAMRGLLEDPGVGKVGHNIKYDLHALGFAGVRVRGVRADTMVGAFLLNRAALGLDWLAEHVLGHRTIPITQLIGPPGRGGKATQTTMDRVPLELITRYAAEDADMTWRLHERFDRELRLLGMEGLARDAEFPLVEVLAEMEQAGVRVDPRVLGEQKAALSGRIASLRDGVLEAAGPPPFNLDSPKQLAEVLFKRLGLPVIKRTQTGPSTDIEVLERLAEREGLPERGVRVAELTVEYRQLSKLVNTYLDALAGAVRPTTGRVHASFHQTGAATGRLSSSDPNLQNIPIRTDVGRMIRKAFLPAEGWSLIAADYSQIELRVLAHLSGDAGLARAFHEDLDIHAAVASQVFGVSPEAITPQQRTHAKTINFGIVYGVTPHGLARRIESLDVEGARRLIGEYHRKFPGISRFLDRCVAQAESLGYVTTILGRRRPIPQVQSHNRSVKSLGERLAINTVVQGSAADLIKLAMVAVHRRIESQRLPLKLLLQIHDELVLESPIEVAREMAEVVREEMVGAMKLSVPLKVGVGLGPSWYEAK